MCVVEDQFQFILHHKTMWEGSDTEIAVPIIEETQALYPDLRVCSFDRGFHSPDNRVRSFDRGFHSPDNRVRLDAMLDLNALPRKGRLCVAEREEVQAFAEARHQHPAVESAINHLEHRGLDRVRSHGADGFAHTVALSILAANVHRTGVCVRDAERRRRCRAA